MFASVRQLLVLFPTVACALAIALPASAAERRILSVELDEEVRGQVRVGVRAAQGVTPTIHPGPGVEETETLLPAYDLEIADRKNTAYWKPFVIMVDATSNTEERLGKIKSQVAEVARRELEAGSRWVWINNQSDSSVKASNVKHVGPDGQATKMLARLELATNTSTGGGNPHYTPLTPWLEQLLKQGTVTRGAPTALIFSSLCVPSTDSAPDVLAKFPGPMRFFTWSAGLSSKCTAERERWLNEARVHKPDIEVFEYDDAAQAEAILAAMQPRSDVQDEFMNLQGVPYPGGVLNIVIGLEGVEPLKRSWTKEELEKVAYDWPKQAAMDKSEQVIKWSLLGFIITVLLLILGAVFKARTQGMEVARWEAVGEAEDLSTSTDPDAWNATIFQLTGAMPALTEFKEAAQLGPVKDETTASAPAPEMLSDEPDTAEQEPIRPEVEEEEEEEEVDEEAAAASTSATPSADVEAAKDGPASTGMTVAIPALDDGTGYDADSPFEIGVLQFGKPVARKTKRFSKVFSIGRATDNRVVIQKDDTVHRYHVVIRPAVEGKEWWLEVSPTASNRTNLNGKDLRSGGRYRLPEKFRLQLGEATEVRGRLAT